MRTLIGLSRLIDRLSEFVGNKVAWLIVLDVVISAGNALSRKGLNMASNAWLELQWYLFGAVFLLAAGYTLKRSEHVRVDLVYSLWSPRTRHWIDLVGHVAFLMPFVLLMIFLLVPYVVSSFELGERSSNVGGLILWPAKALLLLGFILLGLQGVSEIIKKIAYLTGTWNDLPPEERQRAPLERNTEIGDAAT